MSRATARRVLPRTPPTLSSHFRLGVAGAATLGLVIGCGASRPAPALQRVAAATLRPNHGALTRRLPAHWTLTMEVWFPATRSTLRVGLGSAAVMVYDGSRIWHHVELTRQGLVVDGRRTGASPLTASSVTLRAEHGAVEIRRLVIRGAG